MKYSLIAKELPWTPPSGTPGSLSIELQSIKLQNYKYQSFSTTKHYINIEIHLFSIAQSTGQYFPVLPSCQSNAERQLFQYWFLRKVNAGVVIENVYIVTQVKNTMQYSQAIFHCISILYSQYRYSSSIEYLKQQF